MHVLICNEGYIKQLLDATNPRAVEVPDTALIGDKWIDGVLSHSELTQYPNFRKLSPVQFKLLFTAPERVAIKASTDPIVQDFFSIVEDLRLTEVDLGLASTQGALDYLESLNLIAAGRKSEIMTGVVL